jgi:hypothetical protein
MGLGEFLGGCELRWRLDIRGCKLRLDIAQLSTACFTQLYTAMKFRARPNITVIIKGGEGGDKNVKINKATRAKCECGGCGDHRHCPRGTVMQKQVTQCGCLDSSFKNSFPATLITSFHSWMWRIFAHMGHLQCLTHSVAYGLYTSHLHCITTNIFVTVLKGHVIYLYLLMFVTVLGLLCTSHSCQPCKASSNRTLCSWKIVFVRSDVDTSSRSRACWVTWEAS